MNVLYTFLQHFLKIRRSLFFSLFIKYLQNISIENQCINSLCVNSNTFTNLCNEGVFIFLYNECERKI